MAKWGCGEVVKSAEEIMNMLEAFDLTGSLRDAGELSGVSHHTVARYVAAREAGALSDRPAARAQLIDPERVLPILAAQVGEGE